MNRRRIGSVLRHAAQMVGRTLRSYMLLSVTIVLSFSLLLGYLLYTDTKLYNDYKKLFSLSRNIVMAGDPNRNASKMNALHAEAEELGDTYHMTFFAGNEQFATNLPGEDDPEKAFSTVNYIVAAPNNAWDLYLESVGDYVAPMEIHWLEGQEREGCRLEGDEALVSEGVFYALGLDRQETPLLHIQPEEGVGADFSEIRLTVRIVGTIRDTAPLVVQDEVGNLQYDRNYQMRTVVSMELLNPVRFPDADLWQYTVFYTEHPEQVAQLSEKMGCNTYSVYEQQNEALETIRVEKRNKAIIACALLLLLGINLYSSFTNALNDRKFEIGVKRAIGASGWSIVRQFLYESLLVMAVNIALAVVLVTDIAIVYKYIYERIPDALGSYNRFVLYISPYSLGMFGLCAVTLTVVFSLIFAYQSTQVEIVQYLKAE